jgi:hypothetical protein
MIFSQTTGNKIVVNPDSLPEPGRVKIRGELPVSGKSLAVNAELCRMHGEFIFL